MRMDEPAARLLDEAQREPLRAAFITRALGAVASLAAELPQSSLTQAVSAPSDYGTLLRAFEAAIHAGAGADLEGLRTQARVRGVRSRSRLLDAEGGSPLSAAEVAQLMGISRQAVDVRRKKGTLLGLETGRRGYRYPAWQFEDGNALPGLAQVLAGIADVSPWAQLAFMLNPNQRLSGESPLHALRSGRIGDVVEAAHSYGVHGAS